MKYIYYVVCLSILCILFGCAMDNRFLQGTPDAVTVEDAGDCLDEKRCDYPVNQERDVYALAFDGSLVENVSDIEKYIAHFDAECRQIKDTWSMDVDYIPVHARAGSPLKIIVKQGMSSSALPVVTLLAENGGELIFADSEYMGNVEIQLFAPEKRFYIRTEERKNYYSYVNDRCYDNLWVGGEEYTYEVEISEGEPKEIGLGVVSSQETHKDNMRHTGEVHYYHFASSPDMKFVVRVNSEDGSPTFSQIDRNSSGEQYAGGYQWVEYGWDIKPPSHGAFERRLDVERADCLTNLCEYWFAVTDYEGDYGYTYTLEVVPI